MLHALLVLAAEEHETSKTAFYVLGGVLAASAVLLASFGLTKADFPSSDAAQRGVMGLTVLLVLAALAATVLTS